MSTSTTVSNWSSTFPKTVGNVKQSLRFVKKLMAISVSNIAYLRFNLPEDAFLHLNMDGLNFVILKSQTECEQAQVLTEWVKASMEALDKGYLKDLMIMVYLNPNDHNDVFEMYKFSFGPSGFLIEHSGKSAGVDELSRVSKSPVTPKDSLYRETKNLLRHLMVLTQGLNVLPNVAYLTIKTSYHADTPEDYHPQGFGPSSPMCRMRFNSVLLPPPESMSVGKIDTRFHKIRAEVTSLAAYSPTANQRLDMSEISSQVDENENLGGVADTNENLPMLVDQAGDCVQRKRVREPRMSIADSPSIIENNNNNNVCESECCDEDRIDEMPREKRSKV